jgi:hypothetical protein
MWADLRHEVPNPALPDDITEMASNTNLDVTQAGDLLLLAWRTAPIHFAGAETLMHIASTADQRTGTRETTFALVADLR